MKTTTSTTAALTLAMLPALGEALDGGIFAGITTTEEGVHVAIVLLPARGKDMTWQAAQEWAKKQGGVLPSRPVAAILFANAKKHLPREWHWTSEANGATCAWCCGFHGGSQYGYGRSTKLSSVAVRLIQITA